MFANVRYPTAGAWLLSPKNASELRHIRQSEGLTCAELARASGVADRTVKRAEDGESVRPETRYKILRGLNSLSKHDPPYELQDVFPDAPSA